jgi:single-strand DNA-binding protein
MTNLRNRVQLIGNLGMNPETVQTENGSKLVKFSLATSYTYKNQKGEKVTDTQWHNIVGWGNIAELSEKYLKKGDQITVEGRLAYRNYEDKEGQKRYVTEIVMNDLILPLKK